MHYRYVVLVPAALFGGPIISLFAGSLVRLRFLELFPTYGALMLGELIGDVVWYWIGYRSGERFVRQWGKYVGISDLHIEVVKRLFRAHTNVILFLSKVTMGLGFSIVTIFTAGLARIPFGRYLVINILGQFIWSGVLLSLGFLLGYSFLQTANLWLRTVLIIVYLSAFLLIIFFEEHIRNWFIRKYSEYQE